MTPHEWDVLATVLSVAALVTCVRLGWVWGRARLREEYECDGGLMDQTYDEGSDDQWRRMTGTGMMTAADAPTISLTVPASGAEPAAASGIGQAADWLTATHEQLSPEHIQDLPGFGPGEPVKAGGPPGSAGPSTAAPIRAGGLHWWEEAPLPAVLGLGPEFSGDDKTYERSEFRRWQFCQKVGIAYRPVGLDSIEAA